MLVYGAKVTGSLQYLTILGNFLSINDSTPITARGAGFISIDINWLGGQNKSAVYVVLKPFYVFWE